MEKITGRPQKSLRIRLADASAFKKAPGERKYNTIIKSHSTVQNLLGRQSFPSIAASNDSKNYTGVEPDTITDNNLEDPVKVGPDTITDTAAGNDLDGPIREEPGFPSDTTNSPIREESRYIKQMLTTIQGCLDIAGRNLEDRSVQAYLTNTFGEDNAQQILQERISIQDQLEQLFERIKNPNASNPSTDIKNPPTSSFNPPTGSIGEVSGSKS
jgi:hypothetical protein